MLLLQLLAPPFHQIFDFDIFYIMLDMPFFSSNFLLSILFISACFNRNLAQDYSLSLLKFQLKHHVIESIHQYLVIDNF